MPGSPDLSILSFMGGFHGRTLGEDLGYLLTATVVHLNQQLITSFIYSPFYMDVTDTKTLFPLHHKNLQIDKYNTGIN